MFTRVSSVLVALVLAGLVAGCSESPTTQVDAAKAALESARQAEADLYAPELMREATDSLEAAMAEVKKQDDRFSIMRDYDQAEATIATVQQIAERAKSEAAIEKERVRVADSTLIVEIEALVAETRGILAKAPKGKGSRLDLAVMGADVDAAVAAQAQAVAEYEAGSYFAAHQKLDAVKAQVARVKTDVETAIAALKKK